MARSTVGKLATKTAAAAKRMTVGAAKKAAPASKSTSAEKAEAGEEPAAGKKAAPRKATPKKAATKKAATKKSASKGAAKTAAPAATGQSKGKQPATQTSAAKKSPAKKSPAKKAAADLSPAKESPAKKSPAKKSPAKKSPSARSATKKTTKGTASRSQEHASSLAVKADENPWTRAELDEVRAELTADAERLRGELEVAERELDDLMRDAGDGAGNDQADVGSTTFERDHEMSLANNARTMLTQTEHALERIDDGSYGRCESCGQPIGKNRLMAFPRATLCLTCKQKEERR